jgi:hypothetical protein
MMAEVYGEMMDPLEILYVVKNNLEFIQDPDSRGMSISTDSNKTAVSMREYLVMKVLEDINKVIKILEEPKQT